MTILDQRTHERLSHSLQDQLAAKLPLPTTNRRRHAQPVKVERRGRAMLGRGFDRFLDERED
jgi:hypothetical protein